MDKKRKPTVQLFSYVDDQPRESRGTLIPRRGEGYPKHTFTPASAQKENGPVVKRLVVTAASVAAFLLLGVTGLGIASQFNLAAAPSVTLVDPHTHDSTAFTYGPQEALAQEGFFTETRDAFIDESLTFIEIDLTTKQLRFFKKGVLLQSAEIFAEGAPGSWWETPSGLYRLAEKEEQVFTNISQVFLPWQLSFQGNYAIHGWPIYPDGVLVGEDFVGGGIRLHDTDAKKLYQNVQVGTPVLVHARPIKVRDTFVYEPEVPELDTPQYFIADVANGTILAATELNTEAPIASLVKLMTAVVAAEEIDLDGRIRVASPTFVTSLIPRLSERTSVSMYSLLQLLLVESSNEAAETIAGEIGREDFIAAMNAKARQLGMMHTHFADPSGLSAENTSTLGDLFRLTRYIYEQRSFIFEITANEKLPSAYVGGEFDGLINFNEVEDMENFVGGKVGETQAAGKTSISLHKVVFHGEERVIAIILLGSDDRGGDIATLLMYAQNRFGG